MRKVYERQYNDRRQQRLQAPSTTNAADADPSDEPWKQIHCGFMSKTSLIQPPLIQALLDGQPLPDKKTVYSEER